MSVEVILIPLGIAAYVAIRERRRTDLCEKCRQTRITDAQLLGRALAGIGAIDTRVDGHIVTASRGEESLYFQMIDGVFLGRVNDASEETTLGLVAELDSAVGRIVQAEKVEEMRTRAAQLGLVLVGEEVAEDGSIQLVFEEAEQ